LPTRLKLRREAGAWFRQVRDWQPTDLQKGELVYWLEPERSLGLERVRRCEPRTVIFLEQVKDLEFHLAQVSPDEAVKRLDRDLMADLPEAVVRQTETIAKLVEIPCWLLKYGGEPLTIAQKIADHLERSCLPNSYRNANGTSLARMTQT
jgi:hypothetical protein